MGFGKYIFKVKALNIYGQESRTAEYVFHILRPWHRTYWAYIGYVFAALSALFAAAKINGIRLEKEKAVLEKTVRERTAEIELQKEDILMKNAELEVQSEEIAQQRDMLAEQNQSIEKNYDRVLLLNDIGREITSKLILKELIDSAYVRINQTLDAAVFTVGVFDKKTDALLMQAIEDGQTVPLFSYNLADENRLAVWCFKNQKTVFINDMDTESLKYIASRQKPVSGRYVQSVIYLPLFSHQNCIGVLSVQSYNAGAYSLFQMNLFENIAVFVAIALENAENHAKSEKLLLNILPKETAEELKRDGKSTPKYYDKASVIFTDFKGFTAISETLSPQKVVENLDYCFKAFDKICKKHGIEKIKTIGDSYMAAAGIPTADEDNALRAVAAACEMAEFMAKWKQEKEMKGLGAWETRIGVHTGPLVAGVVGQDKFAYDIWGDTVNTASRMESSGEAGRVNISEDTYEAIQKIDAGRFSFEYRGKISAKGKGEVGMYFVK